MKWTVFVHKHTFSMNWMVRTILFCSIKFNHSKQTEAVTVYFSANDELNFQRSKQTLAQWPFLFSLKLTISTMKHLKCSCSQPIDTDNKKKRIINLRTSARHFRRHWTAGGSVQRPLLAKYLHKHLRLTLLCRLCYLTTLPLAMESIASKHGQMVRKLIIHVFRLIINERWTNSANWQLCVIKKTRVTMVFITTKRFNEVSETSSHRKCWD